MNSIFESLYKAQEAASYASDAIGRQRTFASAVTDNEDPLSLRRVKVADPVNPQLSTPWMLRLNSSVFTDEPLPELNQTVLVIMVNDDMTKGFYLPITNNTNPALGKEGLYSFEKVTPENHTLRVGKTLTLEVDSGSSVTLNEDGSVTIKGDSIRFDTGSLSVGGKQIATIEAEDDNGHKLVTRGW